MYRILLLLLYLVSVADVGCEGSYHQGVAGSSAGTGGNADSYTGGDTDTDTAADTDADSDSYSDYDEECADFPWTVETKPINMLVLLDRSKSMEKYTIEETGESYSEVVQAAIDSIVQQHTRSGIINFALNVFPSPAMCTAEYGNLDSKDQSPAVLCQAASQFTRAEYPFRLPDVPFGEVISMDTYDIIRQVLNEVGNCGGTPITKSLQWARTYLNSLNLENDTYVLLATDGAPGCNLNADLPCESSTPGATAEAPEQCLDDLDSVHAIFDLAKDGYETFLVGVGEDIAAFSDVMDVIAYTGGGHLEADQIGLYSIDPPLDRENWYYPATDAETLNSALEDITNAAISCVYNVDWASVPDENEEINEKVVKSCSQMRVFGIPEGLDEKIELTYMERCSDENPDSPDARLHLGWTWKELEGESWQKIVAIGNDVSQCAGVKLCKNACSKLKTIRGIKMWSGVSASFGCRPLIIII
ncbi:MAG: hypothetical protein JXA30_07315 [Deltaproteobacteria bacterium]|nr:hypothetical protein [Deltaproteobacteria bacterium]